jgi:hypothetical protein
MRQTHPAGWIKDGNGRTSPDALSTGFSLILRRGVISAARRTPVPIAVDIGHGSLTFAAHAWIAIISAGNSDDFSRLGSQRSPIVGRPLTLKPQAHMIAGPCPTLSMPHSAQRYSRIVDVPPSGLGNAVDSTRPMQLTQTWGSMRNNSNVLIPHRNPKRT